LFIFGLPDLSRRGRSSTGAFFTNLPAPVGEQGGGMANALYGSFILVGLASLFAVPVGILAAIYLAEYRSDFLGPIVRFVAELLAGVPSIVVGIFGYYLGVKPMGIFSGWAGSFALGVMMIPNRHCGRPRKPCGSCRRRCGTPVTPWARATGRRCSRSRCRRPFPAVVTAIFLSIARVVGRKRRP